MLEHWTELRTALYVARLGTVKAAADAIGVHRATVNRHIDTLEKTFDAPLFQRHARGYTLTELGQEMMDVADRAENMFADLLGHSKGQAESLTGTLTITSLSGLIPVLAPVFNAFNHSHPDITLNFLADESMARLEYGEAHIAIRAGVKPNTPDYVVLPFGAIRFGLYASQNYVKKMGLPTRRNLKKHKFAGPYKSASPLPYKHWLNNNLESSSFALQTNDQHSVNNLVTAGLAIGFMPEHDSKNLVEIIPPGDDYKIRLWLVTHVDLRRIRKVQEFIKTARALYPERF